MEKEEYDKIKDDNENKYPFNASNLSGCQGLTGKSLRQREGYAFLPDLFFFFVVFWVNVFHIHSKVRLTLKFHFICNVCLFWVEVLS